MGDYFQWFTAFFVLFLTIYYYFTKNFDFWKCRGVPGPRPTPVFGNTKDVLLFRIMLGQHVKQVYYEYQNEPMVGIFMSRSPALILRDLNLIKDVLIKDFSIFSSRGIHVNDKRDPFSPNLFNLEPERWRPLRSRLSPVFTSGKIKDMFSLIVECSEQLEKYLEKVAEKNEPVECCEIAAKYTTDVIGSCAFGISINSLIQEDNKFRRLGRKVFSPGLFGLWKFIIRDVVPWLHDLLTYIMPKSEIVTFFTKVISETIDYRKKNSIVRPDFVNMLMELKEHPDKLENVELTDTLLTAQAFVFFAAGFETSSTTIGHALYEMALNPEMQKKLREEIRAVSVENNGNFQYEDIKQMKYLDKVFKETLRKYPPGMMLRRQSQMDYTFSGTKVTIPKNTMVIVPAYAIQHDPSIYPNPDVFDPERFSPEAEAARHPMSFLAFGNGPRNCIGARFAKVQTKIGLIKMLEKFQVDVCEKTLIPYEVKTSGFILGPKGGIYLKLSKAND